MILTDMYYAIKHMIQRNKGICPRCGFTAFEHGYCPFNEYYCTRCHLWEPDWKERRKWIDELKEKGLIG